MNKWHKIGVAVGFSSAAILTIHIINKIIFSTSVVNGATVITNKLNYKWKFGNISYSKTGNGKPILLIHDLKNTSSTYEWKEIIKKLSKSRTVYAIDLLGCGYSDKPNITYTAYLYVQLLNDFITNVIGKRTDVAVTGDSCPFAIMACYNNNMIIDKLFLVNPESIGKSTLIPNKKSNLFRILLNSPVIGTMIYNVCMSKRNIKQYFNQELFYNPNKVSKEILNAYHENAHLYGSSAKYLYTSTKCRYTTASIGRAISEINNCIYIIAGESEFNIDATIEDYLSINPAIEVALIRKCKHLPQLEHPDMLLTQFSIFL